MTQVLFTVSHGHVAAGLSQISGNQTCAFSFTHTTVTSTFQMPAITFIKQLLNCFFLFTIYAPLLKKVQIDASAHAHTQTTFSFQSRLYSLGIQAGFGAIITCNRFIPGYTWPTACPFPRPRAKDRNSFSLDTVHAGLVLLQAAADVSFKRLQVR